MSEHIQAAITALSAEIENRKNQLEELQNALTNLETLTGENDIEREAPKKRGASKAPTPQRAKSPKEKTKQDEVRKANIRAAIVRELKGKGSRTIAQLLEHIQQNYPELLTGMKKPQMTISMCVRHADFDMDDDGNVTLAA